MQLKSNIIIDNPPHFYYNQKERMDQGAAICDIKNAVWLVMSNTVHLIAGGKVS